MLYINVVVDVPLYHEFTYSHPVELRIGTRVLVEFGSRVVIGFVWQTVIDDKSLTFDLTKIKPIVQVFNDVLPDGVVSLIKFAANYYHYPIGQAVFTAIPTGLRKKKFTDEVLANLYAKHQPILNTTQTKIKSKIKSKLKAKAIADDNTKTNLLCSAAENLNLAQQNVVDLITQNLTQFYPCILYGITGSGKTEVYLELIAKIIAKQQQVLVLVPEINLTPQLLTRFRIRFQLETMIILTSNISEPSRLIAYRNAANGTAQIIIGTRLAIFTPFKQLGLIIVDEEHDQSFKQNDGLRYNARDLAVWRANYYKIPVILGSATPSLETLYNYNLGRYHLHSLRQRAVSGATLPQIQLVDLTKTQLTTDGLTENVITAINAKIKQKELSLIFINRRGYAPVIRCYECGFISRCNNCSANMVYHNHTARAYLKCHYCGLATPPPTACLQCGSQNLQTLGNGTQKIEEAINKIFPQARVFRIDYDTTNTKDAWDELYYKIQNQQVDILVGTQMLAKGHDFPNLTLVVGLNLDNGLYSYDFRATEFLFAQLMQVAGRAGRGRKSGVVMLQTYYPQHELYQYLCRHDFMGFAQYLLAKRKLLQLPPYTNYALFQASHPYFKRVMQYLTEIFKLMEGELYNLKPMQSEQNLLQPSRVKLYSEITIYPPVACIMQRLKNRERGQILIFSANRAQLHQFITAVSNAVCMLKPSSGVIWHLDIDPLDL